MLASETDFTAINQAGLTLILFRSSEETEGKLHAMLSFFYYVSSDPLLFVMSTAES